jgi:hypothetical protein
VGRDFLWDWLGIVGESVDMAYLKNIKPYRIEADLEGQIN